MTTQSSMIDAAANIAMLMPQKKIGGSRLKQLVYSVYYEAARSAYRRAAQECFLAAYDEVGEGLNFRDTFEMISDNSVTLKNLINMCETGYVWGGRVKTL